MLCYFTEAFVVSIWIFLLSMNYSKVNLLLALSFSTLSCFAQTNTPDDKTLVVTANRFEQSMSSVLASINVVTRDDIDQWHSTNLIEVLRRLPGIDLAVNGGRGQSASVFVRGTNSQHVLVLIDGVRMTSPGVTGSIDFGQIPLSLVQRIEYVRGSRSAAYGSDAIGGVINIITERSTDGGNLYAGYGTHALQNYNGSTRQTFGNTVISVAGGYESTHGFNVYPTSTIEEDHDKDGFRGKSLWLGLEHTFNDKVQLFGRGFGFENTTDYDKVYSISSSDKRELTTRNYDIGLRTQQGNYSSQLITSYQTYKDYNYDSRTGRDAPGRQIGNITQRSLQWNNTLRHASGTLSAGVDWRQERVHKGSYSLSNSHSRDNTGIYLIAQQQLLNDLLLEAAARGDDNEQFGRYGTWQSSLQWQFIDNYRATLSYGTAFKAPTFGQIYNTAYGDGNYDLLPEKSYQWEFALDGSSDLINWRLSGYRNDIDDMIDAIEVSPWVYQYQNINKAKIKGVEFSADFETSFIQHSLSLEYLNARDGKNHERLARRAKQKAKYQLAIDTGSVNWSLAWLYQGKRTDTNYNVMPYQRVSLGGYSTWDIATTYEINKSLKIGGKISNIFDKQYQTVLDYASAGREYLVNINYAF